MIADRVSVFIKLDVVTSNITFLHVYLCPNSFTQVYQVVTLVIVFVGMGVEPTLTSLYKSFVNLKSSSQVVHISPAGELEM